MSAESEARKLRLGLHELGDATLRRLAKPTRTMIQPLIERIEQAGVTDNDKADLKALYDSLPALFAQMDDAALVAPIASALLQTYAVSRTAAVPEGIDSSDFATEPESLEESMEASA
jgi:hypothetical protein